MLKLTQLVGGGTGLRVQVDLSPRPPSALPAGLSRTQRGAEGRAHQCTRPRHGRGDGTSLWGRNALKPPGKPRSPRGEPERRHYLDDAVILQQHFSCLRLQLPFENGIFYLGKEDIVQFASLENGQLPASLGKVFLLLQGERPPEVPQLQAVQGPQGGAALDCGLRRAGACERPTHATARGYTRTPAHA